MIATVLKCAIQLGPKMLINSMKNPTEFYACLNMFFSLYYVYVLILFKNKSHIIVQYSKTIIVKMVKN